MIKQFFLPLIFCLVATTTFSQYSEEFSKEVQARMKAEGYKFIEEIRGEVSEELAIVFHQKKFIMGYSYKVIMLSPKIDESYLTVQLWDDYEEWTKNLKVEVKFSEYTDYRINVADIHQYNDAKGGMQLFSNTSELIPVQALLFYR